MGGATNWPSALDWPLTDHPSMYRFLLTSFPGPSGHRPHGPLQHVAYSTFFTISMSIWLPTQMHEPLCGWRCFPFSGHRIAAGQSIAATIESTPLEAPCHLGRPTRMSAGRGLEVSVRLSCCDGEPILQLQQQRFERIFCAWEYGEIERGCAVERTNARGPARFRQAL